MLRCDDLFAEMFIVRLIVQLLKTSCEVATLVVNYSTLRLSIKRNTSISFTSCKNFAIGVHSFQIIIHLYMNTEIYFDSRMFHPLSCDQLIGIKFHVRFSDISCKRDAEKMVCVFTFPVDFISMSTYHFGLCY